MGLLDGIKRFLVEMFWPWFRKYAWPFIKRHFLEIIDFIIDFFKAKVKEYVSKKSQAREFDASQKADEAEQNAREANDPSEAEKYRAIAQIWREVAENYRRDYEDLKHKMEAMAAEAKQKAKETVKDSDVKAEFSNTDATLIIGDKSIKLPAPTDSKTN